MGNDLEARRLKKPPIECNAPNVQSSDTIMIRNLHAPDNCAFKLGVWIIEKWMGDVYLEKVLKGLVMMCTALNLGRGVCVFVLVNRRRMATVCWLYLLH